MPRSTRMREPHRQICPEFWNAERTRTSSWSRQSLSANTRVGFLPLSSRDTFFSIGAAIPAMRLPTVVLQVNDTALSAGGTTIASPTIRPSPYRESGGVGTGGGVSGDIGGGGSITNNKTHTRN